MQWQLLVLTEPRRPCSLTMQLRNAHSHDDPVPRLGFPPASRIALRWRHSRYSMLSTYPVQVAGKRWRVALVRWPGTLASNCAKNPPTSSATTLNPAAASASLNRLNSSAVIEAVLRAPSRPNGVGGAAR
jgi:hypothetical protein